MYEAHKEQTDKSGLPYVFHPFHLAEQMDDEVSTVVALLHDVVEDTDCTLDDLRKMGFSGEVCEALDLLTHEIFDIKSAIHHVAAEASDGSRHL